MNFNQAVKAYQGQGQFLSTDGINFYFLIPGFLSKWAILHFKCDNFKETFTLKFDGSIHEFLDDYGFLPNDFYKVSHWKAYTRKSFFCRV